MHESQEHESHYLKWTERNQSQQGVYGEKNQNSVAASVLGDWLRIAWELSGVTVTSLIGFGFHVPQLMEWSQD